MGPCFFGSAHPRSHSQSCCCYKQVSRRLQQDYSLFEFVDVCTRVQNDIVGDYYITDSVLGILIWIYHFGNRPYDIVVGSCDAVCPCGGSGRCKEVFADGHTCECDDGFDFDGRTCLEEGLPICGGFTNATCPDDLVCVDGPGENSTGLCLLGCDILEGGNSTCLSEELQCKMDPQCDVSRENCTSICVPSDIPPFPFCHGTDNVTCEEGYSCVKDDACIDDLNRTCIGVCKPSCAGHLDLPCLGETEVCVDDIQDDCLPGRDANCTGVCEIVPASCEKLGGACPNGFTCTDDPESDCEFGVDCPGICALSCGGLSPFQVSCPENLGCVDDPSDGCDEPLCTDAPGVCLPVQDCNAVGGITCPLRTSCFNSSSCAEGAPCPGICKPDDSLEFCGGVSSIPCMDGSVCFDDPLDDCNPLRGDGDCGGICLLGCDVNAPECPKNFQCQHDPQCDPSTSTCTGICTPSSSPPFPFCDLENDATCTPGFACVSDNACSRNVEDGTCAGTCKQQCNDRDRDSCGQGRVCIDNVCEVIPAACGGPLGLSGLCPNDYSCIANPRTSCEFDTDNECTGVCAVNCGGLLPDPLRCQDNTFCLANPAVTDDTEQSSRVCQEIGPCGIQGGLMSCPFGTQCVKPSRCRTGDPDCPGVCQDEDIPVYCGGDLGPSCPIGRRCADDPRDGCQVNDMFGCEGICEKECGGVDSLQCEGGLFCNDDPFDDCDPAMGDQDCVGICQDVENPPLPCGGEALSGCPLGFECRALNDVLCAENDSSCFGLCRRV